MELIKFKIKNYKSIIDSGDCFLSNGITTLAGKNESGKTSILEALYDFNYGREIEKNKISKNAILEPSIWLTFKIPKNKLNYFLKNIGSKINVESSFLLIEIVKYYPKNYSFSEKTESELWSKINLVIQQRIKDAGNFLSRSPLIKSAEEEIVNKLKKAKTFTDFSELIEKIENYFSLDDGYPDPVKLHFYSSNVKSIVKEIEKIQIMKTNFIKYCIQEAPIFEFFKSFKDIFPEKISLKSIEKNEWIAHLINTGELNLDIVKSSNWTQKDQHQTNFNLNLSKKYNKNWSQDESKFHCRFESNELIMLIKNGDIIFEPNFLSKGKQEHLSFFIKMISAVKNKKNNIILIDEPVPFLHAEGVKDALKLLEELSLTKNIIFSTHSPYLLEFEKLDRIRFVIKDKKEGTQIINKVQNIADKELLTPILDTIGLRLDSSIANINKVKNVVVEGISDVYLLNAFKIIRNKSSEKDINFISGGGSNKMHFVGTILHGWGAKVIYLYDNDCSGKKAKNKLKKNWKVEENLILVVSDQDNECIEDLFTKNDFRKHILQDEKLIFKESNCKYVKKNKVDKVLKAQLFLKSTRRNKPDLETVTLKKFNELFEKINLVFKKIIN